VVSQDKATKPSDAAQKGTGETGATMQQWAKYTQPGEHHARLRPLVGRWNMTVRAMMAPGQPVSTAAPEQPVLEDTGTAEYEWILGGRYVLQKIRGNPEAAGEAPYEGMGLIGYDNVKQKYVAMWVDNMMTAIFTCAGTCDASGKVITLIGEDTDPMTRKPTKVRSVLRIVDENKWVSETYCQGPDGKEFKALEMIYARKK